MSSSTPNLQSSARTTLVSLCEEHVTLLLREAVSVKRHSKRARIHLNQPESSAGSSGAGGTSGGVVKRRLHAEDLNLALQWRGSEKLYATGTIGGIVRGSTSKSSSNKNKSSSDESHRKVIDLQEYLKSEMDLRPPQEVGLTVHWLAVDGNQPEIPQNPIRRSQRALGTIGRGRSMLQHVDEYDNDDVNANDDDATDNDATTAAAANPKFGVEVNQLLPRLLSEELQLYFTRVTSALERGGSTPTARHQQDTALASVARDAGLQELVPFLVNYVSQSLYQHVGHPEHCRTLVRMANSLLLNPHLHLELHLHQLLPALLTCIVAKRLSCKPWENHWILRNEAALALVRACNLFGEEYATLKARVLKTLCDAASGDKALNTQYGGFVAISLFGPKAIDAFLLPLAIHYWNQWEAKLDQTTDLEQRMELQMCEQAVLSALGIFLDQDSDAAQTVRLGWEELEETFGDRLIMATHEETEYALCAI